MLAAAAPVVPTAARAGSYVVDPGPFVVVDESSFETAVTAGKDIRFSTYVLSPTSSLEGALVSAARRGASVRVSLPSDAFVQTLGDVYQQDVASAKNIADAGGIVLWDAGMQSPNNEPLHAKLALIDGTAYLDGRNWDPGDVIVSESAAADIVAIGAALGLVPTDSATLETIKGDALSLETAYLTTTAGATIDYMTESFGAGEVANALIARAQAGTKVRAIVLNSDVSDTEKTTLTLMAQAGIDVELNPGSGSEKMSLVGATAWFGSSNSTAGSPDQIDWGAIFADPVVVTTLQSNFSTTLATCTKYPSPEINR